MDTSSCSLGCHLLAVAATLILVQCSIVGSPEQERAISQSSEFKALDSYLDKQLRLTSTDTAVVVPRLSEVIEALVSLGPDNFATLDGEKDDAGLKFKELLLVEDSQKLLKLARDFSAASRSCDDQALSFIVSITSSAQGTNDAKRQQTGGGGAFLVRYAQSLLDKCWRFHMDRYIARLSKSTGKMHDELFVLIEAIANRLSNARLAKARRAHSAITISDDSLPNNPADKIQALRRVKLLSRQEQQEFMLALRNEFVTRAAMQLDPAGDDDRTQAKAPTKLSEAELQKFAEFFEQMLVEPCRQLLARMGDTVQEIIDSGKLHSKPTLRSKLVEQNPDNFNFIYMLEVNRICGFLVAKLDKLSELL